VGGAHSPQDMSREGADSAAPTKRGHAGFAGVPASAAEEDGDGEDTREAGEGDD
jgi:hypothetical protein